MEKRSGTWQHYRGKVEILERLRDLAKGLQLNREEVKNDVDLLKDKDGKTAWHIAALWCKVEY